MSAVEIGEKLKAHESELQEERRRIQEKDAHIASVRACLQAQQETKEFEALMLANAHRSVEDLRTELEGRRQEHRSALARQRTQLVEEHQTQLRTTLEAKELALSTKLSEQVAAREERARKAKEELAAKLAEATAPITKEADLHSVEAEAHLAEVTRLKTQLEPLQSEHKEATESLKVTRALLRHHEAEQAAPDGKVVTLSRHLADAQSQRQRAEQRHSDLQQYLEAQMQDLRSDLGRRDEELHEREAEIRRKDAELAALNTQLSDLQGLFEEVQQQLHLSCSRIESLQGAVTQCARQGQELQSLQGMVEDSHAMIAQLQAALEEERSEAARTESLLEHEQHRTQLLLDVLKHFKEKLQGLTPQMLLSRLGYSDAKALWASVGSAG